MACLHSPSLEKAGSQLRAQEPHLRCHHLRSSPSAAGLSQPGAAWGRPGREYLQEETRGGQPGRLAQHLLAAHSLAPGLSTRKRRRLPFRREKIASRSGSSADWLLRVGRRGAGSAGPVSGRAGARQCSCAGLLSLLCLPRFVLSLPTSVCTK